MDKMWNIRILLGMFFISSALCAILLFIHARNYHNQRQTANFLLSDLPGSNKRVVGNTYTTDD